ncbi:uncharacterized protein EDB91DRAFT_1292765 [Suillus paluster]|uniref:uncharacterized protein n=1 Tax=Suillus paluster TaxID=48578 RepID=UPI001B87ED50|nr:uncharacterized protein EDB91DRAFT_1292765 [Suillus paluster]KAG1752430.1 hypothetical protein EDB91DRAFT_1292765 [Suillus paluster]
MSDCDEFDHKCFLQRSRDGLYDRIADAMDELGKDAFAEADFGDDWVQAIKDDRSGSNWSYVNKNDGRPFLTNIVGEITSSSFGTKHSAKGTHFSKNNKPMEDGDTVKWKWGLKKPTQCGIKLGDIFENQLTSVEDWHIAEKKNIPAGAKINECTIKGKPDLQYPDIIIITTAQRIYDQTIIHKRSHDAPSAKRKAADDSTSTAQPSTSASTSTMPNIMQNLPPTTVCEGAFYDPQMLPDHRGDYFRLKEYKLQQLNVFDTPENDHKLIPTYETYDKLRPGTLILAVCEAHVFNMMQGGTMTSTFQLSVRAIRILAHSDVAIENRPIPILHNPSTSLSRNDPTVAAFSAFNMGASPSKKTKTKQKKD